MGEREERKEKKELGEKNKERNEGRCITERKEGGNIGAERKIKAKIGINKRNDGGRRRKRIWRNREGRGTNRNREKY